MKRREALVATLGVTLATAFLFWPITFALLTGGDPPWFEWDVPEQYWPDLVYVCESLHDGALPYWNPYDRGGYPFFADPQAAAFHPITWVSCALGGPSPVLDWAVMRVMLGFWLSGVFGLLWLRRLEVPWSGAVVGAVLLEAAPFMRHNWELNLTTAMAFLPLMLFAAERLAKERATSDGALLALATALCGWVGSPPALYLAGALTGLYLVFRLATTGPGWTRALPGVGVAALLAAGLLAVVLVPTAELADHSVQAGRSLGSIAEGGLTHRRLLSLVLPQPGNHLYLGWLALAAAPIALFGATRRRRDRRLAVFFVAVAVVATLMALGTHGPLFEPAFELVPGVRRFRLPHRYEAWLGPAAAALVGLASKALSAEPVASRRQRALGAGLIGLGVGLALGLEARAPGALAGGVGVVVLARTLPAPFHARGALAGLAVTAFVLVDVSQAMPAERHLREGPPPTVAEDRVLAHAAGAGHAIMEFAVACRGGTRHRRTDLRGYQDPLALRSWSAVMGSLREHPSLAPQLGVRWALVGPHFIHGWDRHFLPPPADLRAAVATRRVYRDERERQVLELVDALPPAYFVPAEQVERRARREEALERVIALAPSAIAVLEGAPIHARAQADARPLSEPAAFGRTPDTVRVDIHAPRAGVVVINEAFYPGWTARVDGEPTRVLRANGFARAVRVDAGPHVIELEFAPAKGRGLRWVLALSWLVTLSLLVAAVTRRRRRAKAGA